MEKTSVTKNFIFRCLLTISNIIFPIITFPYVSRVLGPDGTGKVQFAASVIYYFNIFAQLGIPTYGIRVCAQVRDDREKLSRTVQELLTISLITTAFSYAALILSLLAVPRFADQKTLLLIIGSTVLLNAIGMEWLYAGLEKYTYITVRSVIFKLIAVVLMLLLVKAEKDYLLYSALTVLAGSASNILNLIYSRKYVDFRKRKLQLRQHLKPVLIFFAMSIATTVYTNLDTVMLGFMRSDTDVGLYNAALKIRNILSALVTSLGAVLLPRAAYYYEQGETEKFFDISKKSFEFVTLLASALSVYFILFADYGIFFISGPSFEGSILSMRLIMPTLFLIGLTYISGIQMLIPMGKENIVLYSTIAGALIDLIINWAAIPKYGPAGAAFGTLMAETVVLCVQFLYMRREIRRVFRGFPFAQFLLSLAVATGLSLLTRLIGISSYFLALAVSAALFFGSFALLLILFKEPLITELLATVKSKLSRHL